MSSERALMTPEEPVSTIRPQIKGVRLLVVDDDEDFASQLMAILGDLGYSCMVARDGFEALELHRAEPFDVILCDWIMPRMDGVALCQQVRAEESDSYTYFILLTGLSDREHVVKGLRGGADEYLTKPIDFEELDARLESARRVALMNQRLVKRNGSLQRDSERAMRIARIDPLTGVNNRLTLEKDIVGAIAQAKRYGHQYSVGICDVDFFKQYNDSFGHLAGDDVLRRVAHAMQCALREGDRIYRYGGEEFLVILPEQTLRDAGTAMERLRRHVQGLGIPHSLAVGGGVLTISVGAAELNLDIDRTPEDWLRRADKALYRAKQHGRNCVALDTDAVA